MGTSITSIVRQNTRGAGSAFASWTQRSRSRERGIARLYTEASELARPVFERAGYGVLHRRDFDLDGVPIHNFAMERTVAP